MEQKDGPSLWMMWGEMQKAFGRLEEGQRALGTRQDDMRRELLGLYGRLERRMEQRMGRQLGWLRHIPWDRLIVALASALGALGWIRPSWLKFLVGTP